MRRLAMKKKCLQHRALIISWLRLNYCLVESGSIAKQDVFVHYIDMCRANRIHYPSSAASFGKILKLAFPSVQCNRVGPRGASKHHYRGLALRGDLSLSLGGITPVSEQELTDMMNKAGENGNDDDDYGEDSDGSGAIKSESPSPNKPHYGLSPHQSSPFSLNDAVSTQVLPVQHQLDRPYPVIPPPQPVLPNHSISTGGTKDESFSWVSPEMDSPARRPLGYPVLPPPPLATNTPYDSSFQSSSTQPAPASSSSALAFSTGRQKEELPGGRQDVIESCESNFASLYEAILNTETRDESKEQVLASIEEAWRNFRHFAKRLEGPPNTQILHAIPERERETSRSFYHGPVGGQLNGTRAIPYPNSQIDQQRHHKGESDPRAAGASNNPVPPPFSAYVPQPKQESVGPSSTLHHQLPGAQPSGYHHLQQSPSGYGPTSFSGTASASLSFSWLNSMAFPSGPRAGPTRSTSAFPSGGGGGGTLAWQLASYPHQPN